MKISTVKDFSRTASCSINDNIDCMTQCKKFSNEKMRISRNTDCEKGQTQLETFHQKELETVSLEITITTKIPTVQNIEQSIAIAPGEEEKPISILNDFITKKRPFTFVPDW